MMAMRSTSAVLATNTTKPMSACGSHCAASAASITSTAQRSIANNTYIGATQGISTAATTIRGGVTSESASRSCAPRRISPPPTPDMSDWVDNGDGTITCVYCGQTIPEDDYYDVSHLHGYGICTTPSPIVEDIATILFVAILACMYVLVRKRKRDLLLDVVRVGDMNQG